LSGGTWSPNDWSKIKRSLGPYRISSALEDSGYSSFVLEYCEEFTADEIIKAISAYVGQETLWLGFSSTFFWPEKKEEKDSSNQMYYTSEYSEVLKVIDYVKENSNAKIIYGGAKVPFYIIDDHIDYYITGNADNSIIDVTDFLAGKIDKIQHTETYNNHVIVDSLKYPEPDVKNIPTRWWNKEYNILPNEGLPIELARGCIFKCKFCNYPLLGKKKGTYLRESEQIKEELIKTWESHGTDTYYLTDDTFNDDNDKLDALHKVFTSLPFKPKFSCYLRIDLINKYPHQADQLVDMGLIGNFFGLETLQPESAKAIGKGLHPNKVKDRLYWLREKWNGKVNSEAGFILGLPYDTMAYFNDLLMWTLEEDNPLQSIHFYPLMLFHYKEKELRPYSSEFSINPEIYGYEFNEGNSSMWTLPNQKLNYRICRDISNKFAELRNPMNKISGFHMITTMNTGVDLHDIYTMTNEKITQTYDIPNMNNRRIQHYKSMVGAL
jgi:hypothetical protein